MCDLRLSVMGSCNNNYMLALCAILLLFLSAQNSKLSSRYIHRLLGLHQLVTLLSRSLSLSLRFIVYFFFCFHSRFYVFFFLEFWTCFFFFFYLDQWFLLFLIFSPILVCLVCLRSIGSFCFVFCVVSQYRSPHPPASARHHHYYVTSLPSSFLQSHQHFSPSELSRVRTYTHSATQSVN